MRVLLTAAFSERPALRIALVSLAGSSIEWYDFFIYGIAAALVFPQLFFPPDTPILVAQFAAFSTFAVGFLARPVGAAVFGHIGDRVGRKKALVTALLMMGCSTTLMGVLPPYASIGWTAPVMLVVLRFAQGFAVGGQWGGAVLLAIEHAPSSKRGFYGSFAQAGVPVGVVVANLAYLAVNAVLTRESFLSWGWRIPFLASICLVVLGLYVQLKVEETPSFRLMRKSGTTPEAALPPWPSKALHQLSSNCNRGDVAGAVEASPILRVLRDHPKEVLLTAGAFIASNASFYIFIAFSLSYATETLNLPQSLVLTAVLIGSVLMIPALLVFAAISDRLGRRKIFMVGAALSALWAFCFFPLVELKSLAALTTAVSVGLVLLSMMYGPQAAFFAESFSTNVRYSGASLGYQIGSILGGGMAPLIATALFANYLSSKPIALYMAVLGIISFASAYMMHDAYGARLDVTLGESIS